MTTLTYSVNYAIRNINTVMAKGWRGRTLVNEIASEAKRLNVDEKEILRHYAISKIDPDGTNFIEALKATGEMSLVELQNVLN